VAQNTVVIAGLYSFTVAGAALGLLLRERTHQLPVSPSEQKLVGHLKQGSTLARLA